MPRLESIRTLTLAHAPASGLPRFVSAASGLVRAGGNWYVVGDDLHHLGVFPKRGRARGQLVRLFPGDVPDDSRIRKRRKPDLETLVLLPAFAGHRHGAMLALGSGSRRRRRTGVLIALDPQGGVVGGPMPVDLSALYAPLAREFGDLNLEGAFVAGDYLVLLQRGHRGRARNARVRVKLGSVFGALAAGSPLPGHALHDVTDYDLGAVEGVPLCFTDGAALRDGGFAFTAVAESTDDSYADGACVGSAIGIMGRDDRLLALWRLAPALKVEGIAVRERGRNLEIHVVTDADDPAVPAALLTVTMSLRSPGRPRAAPLRRT